MSLTRALNDVRKMKRSVRLRGETDPEVVANTLDAILKESIAVRAADSRGMLGRGATNELRNLRSDLVANQLNAGTRTGELIGKFSMVLDQMDEIESNERQSERSNAIKGTVGAITSAIPSASTITSALITANPILGYSAKIVMDMMSSRSNARKSAKDEAGRRLKLLREQQTAIEAQMKTEEMEQSNASAEAKKLNERDPSKRRNRRGIYQQVLESIQHEIQLLREILGIGQDQEIELTRDQTEQFRMALNPVVDSNQLIVERVSDVADTSKNIDENGKKEMELERENREVDQFNAIEAERTNPLDKATSIGVNREKGGIGMLGAIPLLGGLLSAGGGLLAGAGALAGGLLSRIFGPFTRLINFFTKGAKLLKISGVLTVITSLYDFVDGFMSASDILDKAPDAVTIKERIAVGVSSIISGLMEPIDWIMGWFGGSLYEGTRDDLTRRITDGFLNFNENIVQRAKDSLTELYDTIVEKIIGMKDSLVDWVTDKFDWIPGVGAEEQPSLIEEPEDRSNGSRRRGKRNIYVPQRSEQITQEAFDAALSLQERPIVSPTNAAAQTMSESDSRSAGQQQGRSGGSQTNINAPSNSTTVNNSFRSGPLSTSNNEPSFDAFRRMSYSYMAP